MSQIASRWKLGVRIAIAGLAILALSACVARYRNHGYVPPQSDLDELVVGVDTRDSVAETVGTPSATGVLNDSGYYYVATRMRHFGARQPQVVERRLVAISFDSAGVVRNIERYSLADGKVIALDRRVTETGTETGGFLRQLIGNLGNFSPAQALQ